MSRYCVKCDKDFEITDDICPICKARLQVSKNCLIVTEYGDVEDVMREKNKNKIEILTS